MDVSTTYNLTRFAAQVLSFGKTTSLCTIPDCYEHPEHLAVTLKGLFGTAYTKILGNTNSYLGVYISKANSRISPKNGLVGFQSFYNHVNSNS